jgi:hypothetical protein
VCFRALQRAPRGAARPLSVAEQKELARKARPLLLRVFSRPSADATLRSAEQASAAKPAREKLSDAAPPVSAAFTTDVVKLNVRKRDLRGIEAVQAEMRARKEPRPADAAGGASGGAEGGAVEP